MTPNEFIERMEKDHNNIIKGYTDQMKEISEQSKKFVIFLLSLSIFMNIIVIIFYKSLANITWFSMVGSSILIFFEAIPFLIHMENIQDDIDNYSNV